ncbi:hypothetical protein SFRURICE_015379 [Spodoptera frugiperda]|nr:hypothetical protein SFRURICE_015379 [Spodoptera frugiperda]
MTAIFEVCKVLSARKVHQELAELQRELARVSASNAALEAQLRSTKAELAAYRGRQSQTSADTDMLGLMRREMAAFQQRFDVLENRLLRPPLAASSSYAAVAAGSATSSVQTGRSARPPVRARAAAPARVPATPRDRSLHQTPLVQAPVAQAANLSAGRRKRRDAAAQQDAPATGEHIRPASASEWQLVGEARRVAKDGRNRRKKEQRQRRRMEKRAAAMLVAPKTAAVVMTLQPARRG